jgi:hypothetical protein
MVHDIFLPDRYNCNTKNFRKKINCEYWSIDEESCTTNCSLKNINPATKDCALCKERKEIVSLTISVPRPKLLSSTTMKNPQDKKTFLQKAVSYGKAEVSQLMQGKVSDEVYNKRKEICLSCDYKVNPTPQTEPIGWCKGGCGCKIGNPRASLSQKLYMPTITCPLKKFGPEQGQGFNITDAIDSVKGAATAVTETLKSDTEENK